MQTVFQQLPLEAALERLEAATRSANRWSLAALVAAVLLWIWARAPSFDVVPALIGFVVKLAALFTYGLVAPADSFVATAARQVNLGYAVVFGPLILLSLAAVWYARERRVAELLVWLGEHRDLAAGGSPGVQADMARAMWQRRGPGALVKGLIVAAACAALLIRYTDFRARPDIEIPAIEEIVQEYCAPIAAQGCECTGMRVDPWPGAQHPISWWWPWQDWCVSRGRGWHSNFHAVLPGTFFEKQMAEKESAFSPLLAKLLPLQADGKPDRDRVFLLGQRNRPYDAFPYVYPTATVWLNTAIFFVIFGVWLSHAVSTVRDWWQRR